MICGVDEAGKGSVLGPMVIAAVAAADEDIFSDLTIRDSKTHSAKERERLAAIIRKRCRVTTVKIDAQEIDAIRLEMTMNACVARAHAQAINKLGPKTAYVDACDVNEFRYAEMVRGHLTRQCEIVSEHHADSTFVIVSAASIIAKVARDKEILKLAKTYGAIGSGYPADPVTVSYLSSYIDEHRHPPPIARKSWKTVIAMIGKKEQSSLERFF
jgi:ribonuclease HII